MENYKPYKDREEHDFINSLTIQFAKIYSELSEMKKITDKYLEATMQRRRKEDE